MLATDHSRKETVIAGENLLALLQRRQFEQSLLNPASLVKTFGILSKNNLTQTKITSDKKTVKDVTREELEAEAESLSQPQKSCIII